MAFIGTPLDTRNTFQSLQGKRFDGDGSTTAFTLDVAPSSTLDIEVFVGNVRQDPNSAYTLSGTTLTFTGAPPSGTNNIYVVHQAKSVGTIDPPATISSEQAFSAGIDVNGTEIKLDADADTSITADTDDQIDIKIGGNDDFKLTAKTLSIGGAAAADSKIVFDGNAQDYHIGLDDSADDLVIGLGSALGTTTHMVFDETGAITKPLQPSFLVSAATQSNITGDNTDYDLLFTNEIVDRNADYGSSLFTAPITGLYQLSASLYLTGIAANHTSVFVSIVTSNRRQYIVGVDGGATDPADSGEAYFNGSALFDMDANDTAKIQIDVRGGSKVVDIGGGTDAATFFSGALIA
jgi:hypothetical protein